MLAFEGIFGVGHSIMGWCVILLSSCALQIHYNGDDDFAFISVDGVALGVYVRTGGTCVLEFEGVIGVGCSMRS